jgi:hypothetical protein
MCNILGGWPGAGGQAGECPSLGKIVLANRPEEGLEKFNFSLYDIVFIWL